ncbi:UNVERIFIED_CONTAM: hypothetical protein Scaly_1601200 [Sesamum calycinum]|uniref:Transposase MuDR plant domain-containing protein n=1 Tax=Sesamum calycinum TaxID=2727403 RepID=A0AAW2P7J4_9LAMI
MTFDGVVIEGTLVEATSGTDTDDGGGGGGGGGTGGGAVEDIASDGDGDGATHGDEEGVLRAIGEGGTSGGVDDDTLTVKVLMWLYMYYGGEGRNVLVAKYIGGKMKKFDYVNATDMNKYNLDMLAEKYGLSGDGTRVENAENIEPLNIGDDNKNADKTLWMGSHDMNADADSNSESHKTDMVGNNLDENRVSDGEENGESCPVFNPIEQYDLTLELGLIFNSKKKFKNAIQSHAIKNKRSLRFTKMMHSGYAVCTKDGCEWKIHASKKKDEQTFKIISYKFEHTCVQVFNVRNVSTKWLSERFLQDFKTDPKEM